MNSAAVVLRQKLFGLVQLDAAGTVLYLRAERGGNVRGGLAADYRGRNFYSEVAPFENVEEFQQCLDTFLQSSQQASSITFTCRYDDGPVQVKILLSRVLSEDNGTQSILFRIRKV